MAEISQDKADIREPRAPQWRLARYVVALVGLLVVAGLLLFRGPLFSSNFRAVIPNEVYRSAQLPPVALERRIRELGLRSVINLRTYDKEKFFLKTESDVTEVHGVDLHLVWLSMLMPNRATLWRLVHLLDTAKRPLLLHCKRGVDRSGIASAVAVLLAGGNVSEARKQFGLTYGFVRPFSPPDLPKVLDHYERWLAVQGWSHAPERFRRWVRNDYVPDFYGARLEPLELPTSIARGSGAILHFRATNTSQQPWRMNSKRDQGVHLGARVLLSEPSGGQLIELRGGFRDLILAPGESVVLNIEIPPLFESGRYKVVVDMVDDKVHWFSEMGSEPFKFEFRVEDSNPLIRKSVSPLG
jgi:protein tyrosine phosphatase (PTP) superfamily phosphohydrolase (DUF442 family)